MHFSQTLQAKHYRSSLFFFFFSIDNKKIKIIYDNQII